VRIAFVAGFGPITTDTGASLAFWRDDLGLPMEEIAPDYWGTDDVEGVKAFAAWPLPEAAESCFGTRVWPDAVPAPQAWLEVDVLSGDAVGEAAAELEAAGHRLLKQPTTEPWGQTVARLLSPEGVLVGITYTPWMHRRTSDTQRDEAAPEA
jgi:catechol 2,3-dioxygenase-like lactoylglutathione lyase family enzyme